MNILPMKLFEDATSVIISLMSELVAIDSPSTDKAAVDRLGARIRREIEALDGQVEVDPNRTAGDSVIGRFGSGPGGLLLLLHMDTVFDLGTAYRNPFREVDGRLYGQGTLDMKASIAMLLVVLRIFRETGTRPARPITALFSPDEETGSEASRARIEAEARKAVMTFCMEPALASGALKTARKGTGDIIMKTRGVSAHAGINHEVGRNAIEEMAHHILSVQRLTDYAKGTTVNVGVVRGGARGNVVPDEAWADVDFRVTSMAEYERLERWAHSREAVIDGAEIAVSIVMNRPPVPRDEKMARSFARAQEIGRAMGLELTEASTGGGSDANFVAPLGVPVLDGLGPIGDGAHSDREFVWIRSLPERTALLANLLLNW